MRKVNILIYRRTRIRKRKRKQHILGITLQPLEKKTKEKLQLNFEPVVLCCSPYRFRATHQTTSVRVLWKTLKQTWGRKYLHFVRFILAYLGVSPLRNTTKARKLRQLPESLHNSVYFFQTPVKVTWLADCMKIRSQMCFLVLRPAGVVWFSNCDNKECFLERLMAQIVFTRLKE